MYYININKCKKQGNFLKIKVHFVLYYEYYSYLCNIEKEIKDRITYHKFRFYFFLVECLI